MILKISLGTQMEYRSVIGGGMNIYVAFFAGWIGEIPVSRWIETFLLSDHEGQVCESYTRSTGALVSQHRLVPWASQMEELD